MDRNRATHACRMRCVWAHQVYVCVTEHNGRCACAIDMDVVDVVMFTSCRVSRLTCAYGVRDAITCMACCAGLLDPSRRATAKCEFSKRAGVQLETRSASGGGVRRRTCRYGGEKRLLTPSLFHHHQFTITFSERPEWTRNRGGGLFLLYHLVPDTRPANQRGHSHAGQESHCNQGACSRGAADR